MTPDIQPHRDHVRRWYDPPDRPKPGLSDAALLRRLLLVLLFAIVVFALGHTMVHDRFFTGGALNNHQGHTVGPQ